MPAYEAEEASLPCRLTTSARRSDSMSGKHHASIQKGNASLLRPIGRTTLVDQLQSLVEHLQHLRQLMPALENSAIGIDDAVGALLGS